jgi:anti-sigma factor RsiW
MTRFRDKRRPTDADLIAFLDGELSPSDRAWVAHSVMDDPELQHRMVLLTEGNRPFAEAFEPLLTQAPKDRLEDWLAEMPASQPANTQWWKGAMAIAAGILLFVAGIGVDRLLHVPAGIGLQPTSSASQSAKAEDLRQAIAEYLSLYTSETLASVPDDMNLREKELSVVGGKMRLALSAQRIALQNLSIKRAQVYEYEGRPLGCIAYLHPSDGPVALCIATHGHDTAPQAEQRQGLNVVHWSRGGHGFMLIGKAPVEKLREYAQDLSGRLAG